MSMWVSPTFDEDSSKPPNDPNRQRPTKDDANVAISGASRLNIKPCVWAEHYEPSKKEELAVNSKKIHDLEVWVTLALRGKLGEGPVAILAGPSGSGKTTTLKVLSKHMSFEIKEWVTPSSFGAKPLYESFPGYSWREQYSSPSTNQLVQFEDFLFRASRYSDLFDARPRCVLLVEDIPNIFMHDPHLLEKTLHKYVDVGRSPLVFVCSNSSTDFNLERMLFKPKLQNDLKIANISFNPINKTLMVKALHRISNLVKKEFSSVFGSSHFPVAEIVNMAGNDIRFAVNHLQFIMCGRRGPSKNEQPTVTCTSREVRKVGKKAAAPDSTVLVGKDQPADVFRSLGRVLYSKREKVLDEISKEAREKLVYDPDEIVSKMSSVPGLFHGLLVENYPGILNDIKNISMASDFLSQSDILMSNWNQRDTRVYYGLNISVHGLMSLSSENIKKKWSPFKGSRAREVISTYKEREKKCKDLFPNTSHDCLSLLTEIFPFLSRMGMPGLNLEQKKFVQDVVQSTLVRIEASEFLGKGCGDASCSTSSQQASCGSKELESVQNNGREAHQCTLSAGEEHEIDIEDYSSDD